MTSTDRVGATRVATLADTDAIVATITTAFLRDPLWGPAFPDDQRRAEQAAVMWRLYVCSALRYPWTLVTPNVHAAAVWIPPGGTELTHHEEDGLHNLLAQTVGSNAARAILGIYDQLEAAHPAQSCFYLSLLGVREGHRGHGLGMGLLAESLTRIDALGAPASLESSNPVNNARYQSVGFVPLDQITTATGHVVTTIWRPAH